MSGMSVQTSVAFPALARGSMRALCPLFSTVLMLWLASCNNQAPGPESRTELVLGTTVTITIYDDVPNGVFKAAFDRVREIESKMSTSEQDYDSTELMEVNRNAGVAPVKVSEDTLHVVENGLRFAELSGGLFDITIEPLVDLWGIGTESEQIPGEEEISELLPLIDFRNVTVDSEAQTIFLSEDGMGIDVGGIAKGYAADDVARILTERGVEHAILDFGGNIVTLGTKPDGSKWRIGIQSPGEGRGDYLGIATTGPKTIVTSGNYERFFIEDGTRYHHILHPETGYPARSGLDSVTIVTDRSMAADALSTATYIMGLEEGMEFVEGLSAIEAIFVTHEQEVYLSSGMDEIFSVTNDSYALQETEP